MSPTVLFLALAALALLVHPLSFLRWCFVCPLVIWLAFAGRDCNAADAEHERLVIGAHLVTAHTKPEGKESGTPGLYLRWPNGITVGAYRNSYGDGSVYAGYTFEAFNRHLALTVGAVTGYRAQPVLPLVVPSVRIGLWGDTSLRVAYLPKPPKYGSSAAVHFSVEARF